MARKQHTMVLFKGSPEENKRIQAIRHGIVPMIPEQHRRSLRWDMFLRCAAQQLEGKEFSPETLLPALMTFAMAGILPNKYNHHGYLIPYRHTKSGKTIVTPVFGYQGLIHLAYQSRSANGARLLDVRTGHILESDDYDSSADSEGMVLSHRARGARNPTKKPKDFLLAYARFVFGVPIGHQIHTYERIQVSTSGEVAAVDKGTNVWKSHWTRMAEKTPTRRACASGRVELAYLAGAALSAEGYAQSSPGQYMTAVQEMAGNQGHPHSMVVEGLEEARESVAVEETWSTDRYRETAKFVHVALGAEGITLEKARELSERLAGIREEMGAPPEFRDEIASSILDRLEASGTALAPDLPTQQ
jgi:recombinational DNA repair protein RecT